MTVEELKEQLKIVQQLKCETQNLELNEGILYQNR